MAKELSKKDIEDLKKKTKIKQSGGKLIRK